jgi:colanic acid/amylovoran biosynthesis glycosyltransferase
MRVLYLLRYFPTLTETFVYREIAEILRQDPSVRITIAALGSRADGALQDELPPAEVLQVPRRPLVGRLSRPTAGQGWLAEQQRDKDAARLPWLARHAASFDRVHVHFAGEAAEFAHALHRDLGLPYTVTVHATDLFRPRPSLHTVLSAAQTVLTVADFHVAALAEQGINARRVRCGPDLSVWRPLPLPDGGLHAISVGRNVPKKGLDTLLAAWPGVTGRLTLISDITGPVPDGVTVTGPLPPSAVRAAMARANLLVLPCRQAPDGDLDGVPVAMMEAMASGRPVVTTPVSGIPELIDEAVGWLVPPDDPTALRACLSQSTHTERLRRGAAGPERLRERGFTLEDQARSVRTAWG